MEITDVQVGQAAVANCHQFCTSVPEEKRFCSVLKYAVFLFQKMKEKIEEKEDSIHTSQKNFTSYRPVPGFRPCQNILPGDGRSSSS